MKTDLHSTRNLITDWRDGDAEKLVRLEHASQSGWPGSGGWETTPEEQERGIKEGDCFGVFVTEEDGEMIAICTVRAKPGQNGNCYIPYLNCRPEFHGKKHGKATLWAAVECAFERGIDKIDINTWPANRKSVPLYKKMGFMWKPETAVFLENFTPIARRHPWGRSFFTENDWYATLCSDVNLEPDLLKRGKARVYEYTWGDPEGGDFLRMVFDPRSWGPIEIENKDFCIECSLTDEKLIACIEHRISYRFRNKTDQAIEIPLSVSGDPGIEVKENPPQLVQLEGGAESTFTGTFMIDPEISEKQQDPKAAILRTSIKVADKDLELAAGFNVRQAIEISLDPSPRSCVSVDREDDAVVTLKSNLEEASDVEVEVKALSGGIVLQGRKTAKIGPRGGSEISIPVRAESSGAFQLQIEVTAVCDGGDRRIPCKLKRPALLARGRLQTSAAASEDFALLAGPGACVHVNLRKGWMLVFRTLRAERALRFGVGAGELGPPFSWDDFFQERGQAEVEKANGDPVLLIRPERSMRPGITLERRIRIVGDGLVEVADRFTNASRERFDLKHAQHIEFWLEGITDLVVPHPDGVRIQAGTEGGPGAALDRLKLPKEGADWSEGWMCRQRRDGTVAAMIWTDMDRLEYNWGWRARRSVGELPPGRSAVSSPLYLYAGDGDWRTVRGWWRVLSAKSIPEVEQIGSCDPRPVFETAFEPNPLIVKGGAEEVTLRLEHAGELKINGVIEIEADPGLRVETEAASSEVTGVNRHQSRKIPMGVRWTADASRLRASVVGRFRTEEASYRADLDVLRGRESATCMITPELVEGIGTFEIATDSLSVRVAPAFQGSVISLKREGREYLNSPFPEPQPFGWMNPWYGGIMPGSERLWGSLYQEKFEGHPVERPGSQGLVWRGVRVECSVQQDKGRGHMLFWEYLVTDAFDVVAICLGCRDEMGIRGIAGPSLSVYPSFSKREGEGVFRLNGRERVTPFSPPHSVPGGHWNWGGVMSRAGHGLYLGSASPFCKCSGEAEGRDQGCMLRGELSRPMGPGETAAGLFFVAPVESAEEADILEPFCRFRELP